MDTPKNKHHVDVKATIKAGNNLDLANYQNDLLDYRMYSNQFLENDSIWDVNKEKIEK